MALACPGLSAWGHNIFLTLPFIMMFLEEPFSISLSRFISVRALAFLTSSLGAQTVSHCSSQVLRSFFYDSLFICVAFLALLPILRDGSLLSLEKVTLKHEPAFLGPSSFYGLIQADSSKQILKEAQVCYPDTQGCEFTVHHSP